jgi:acetyltransferase
VETTAYPAHLARERHLADGRRVTIRPIRPDDEPAARRFFAALSDDARHMRFQKWVRAVGEKTLHSFTHIDYDRHMAFVCVAGGEIVGEARYVANADGGSCEFAVVIADAWHKSGIAGLLMQALISAARSRGMQSMEGLVLRENRDMLRFVRALGFEAHHEPLEPTLTRVTKLL